MERQDMRIGVIIAAGGSSRRFQAPSGSSGAESAGDDGGSMSAGADKLAQDLGGRPLLIRTVECFAKREEVRSIIIAGPAEGFDAFRDRYGPTLGFHGATVVKGGLTERWESVSNALTAMDETCTHIAVHDAARPAVRDDLLNRLFEAAAHQPAVVPGVALRDTVKRVSADEQLLNPSGGDDLADVILGGEGRIEVHGRAVEETLERTHLVGVQTPQVFDASLLRRAYEDQSNMTGVTDDAMLVERIGERVFVVPGDPRNIKVTTRDDLDLVRAILNVKPPAERAAHKRF